MKNNFDMSLKLGANSVHKKRQFSQQKNENYKKKYLKNGLIKKNFLIKTNCPVCKKHNKETLFNKGGGNYKKCNYCTMIYLDPVFKNNALNNYYKNNHDAQSQISINEKYFYNKMFGSGLNLIKSSKKKIDSLLDIGCSNGLFLDLVKKKQIKTYGIELNNNEYKISSKKHSVECKSIFSYKVKKKFDCITMWDVIEHIKDTNKLFNKINLLLNKGGLFFFQTPNAYSLASIILQEKCNVFDGIEHTNLFSLKSINFIAKKHSFKIKKISTVISEIPIINNYLNYENPYLGKNKEKKILNTINEKEIHKNLLGYKFQVILEKQK